MGFFSILWFFLCLYLLYYIGMVVYDMFTSPHDGQQNLRNEEAIDISDVVSSTEAMKVEDKESSKKILNQLRTSMTGGVFVPNLVESLQRNKNTHDKIRSMYVVEYCVD